MSQSARKVSVVVEAGASDSEANHTSAIGTLNSLVQQNYPLGELEIIVCQQDWNEQKKRFVQERFPNVKILSNSDGGYYRLKNLGIQNSSGDIIALADSDCLYASDWISNIVDMLESKADVSVGLTVLAGNNLFRRLCAFYDLHSMLLRSHERVRRFNSNNVAFKSDVIKSRGYDSRFDRTGGCVQLAERLYRSGVRMELNIAQVAVHEFYGFNKHTWKQAICNGYDIFHTRQIDPEMPLAALVRLGILAPPVLCGIFILADVKNVVENRSILKVRWYEVPVFFTFSVLVRTIEIFGMYWTLIHPKSIAAYVDRNFA